MLSVQECSKIVKWCPRKNWFFHYNFRFYTSSMYEICLRFFLIQNELRTMWLPYRPAIAEEIQIWLSQLCRHLNIFGSWQFLSTGTLISLRNQGGGNKRGAGAKLTELINKEGGINKNRGIYLQIYHTKWMRRVEKCNKSINHEGGMFVRRGAKSWKIVLSETPRLLERWKHLFFLVLNNDIDLIKACSNLLTFYLTNSINFNAEFQLSWDFIYST